MCLPEPDAIVRERILLLRCVIIDNQEAASVAELEFHRARGWAYKWLKKYNNEGMLKSPISLEHDIMGL